MDARSLYDGIGRLLSVSATKEAPKPVNSGEEKSSIAGNGDLPSKENGVAPVEQTEDVNANGIEEKSPPPPSSHTDETPASVWSIMSLIL